MSGPKDAQPKPITNELTREQIENALSVMQALLELNDECVSGQSNVCIKRKIQLHTLALRALDMEPRPIADAPNDGTTIWAFWGDEWVKTYWAKRDKFEGWQMPQGMTIKAYAPETWKPTHFLPLSSLPTPKDN